MSDSRVPLVAIATPVYNGARFLADTMECVQAQTYPNLVHCVLDNASIDATPEIIARFRGGRVPLITARNATTLPHIENWNAALELVPSGASYFRVLAADDLIVPECIEKMVALGEQNPHAGVIGCQEWVNKSLHGTDLPSDRSVFAGRSLVRGTLLMEIDFPYVHCLFRYPSGGIPKNFYDTEHHGVRLLCTDVDAVMRVLSQSCCAYVHEPLTITRWPGSVQSTESNPNKQDIWSFLQLIDRWGPTVFDTETEYLKCRARYLRCYYLHLLHWATQRKFKLVEQHQSWLRAASVRPTILDYAHAVVEWPFLRITWWLKRMAPRAVVGLLTYPYQFD